MAWNWTLSEADLRRALFGQNATRPAQNEWCDHVPMRIGPNQSRLCRCGKLSVNHDEMTACQVPEQFIDLVRAKIVKLEGGAMFGIADAFKKEMADFKKLTAKPDWGPLAKPTSQVIPTKPKKPKSSAGMFVPFFEQIKGIPLDPRWQIRVIDNPDSRDVVVRLFNTQSGQAYENVIALQELYNGNPQDITDMLVQWITSVAGPPIPPVVPAPVQKPYTCCFPGCGKKYGPADWCPNGHGADTWADVMIMARARDLTAKNERMKASLEEADVDTSPLPPGKTRAINLDDE